MQDIINTMTANLQSYAEKPDAKQGYITRQNELIQSIATTFNAQEKRIEALQQQLQNDSKPLGQLVDLHRPEPKPSHKPQSIGDLAAVFMLKVVLPGVLRNAEIDQTEKTGRIKALFQLPNVADLCNRNPKLSQLKFNLLNE